MNFTRWVRIMRRDHGFPNQWDSRRLGMVRELIEPITVVYSEIGQIVENREPKPQR